MLTLACADTMLRFEDTFDGIAARRVELLLRRAAAGARFILDLTRAGEIHDFALAVLADAMAATLAEVTVRGVHHQRVSVLRQFGVDTDRLEAAAIAA